MTGTEPDVARFKAAGAAALRFNAPLGPERADTLVDFVLAGRPSRIVDLGCGRGTLAHLIAAADPSVMVRGIDTDPDVISAASAVAERLGLDSRCEFVVADAASEASDADVAICIGASHAFGSANDLLGRLSANGHRRVLIGDGVWEKEPGPNLRSLFGELLTAAELSDAARAAGWLVGDSALSSLDEWDAFEGGWCDGVRSIGTPAATAFADQRWAEYATYRGVLGFAWLQLLARP